MRTSSNTNVNVTSIFTKLLSCSCINHQLIACKLSTPVIYLWNKLSKQLKSPKCHKRIESCDKFCKNECVPPDSC